MNSAEKKNIDVELSLLYFGLGVLQVNTQLHHTEDMFLVFLKKLHTGFHRNTMLAIICDSKLLHQ